MKRSRIFQVVAAVWMGALFLLPAVILCAIGFSASRFGDTYYGALAPMWKKLKTVEGPKSVIVGNSAVAFGVDSALLQEELEADGFEYAVCNFGLYGAIGTRAMLDLSEKYIKKDDIVLFMPEINAQSLSLYFSAKDFWYAADSDFSLLFSLDGVAGTMAGTFASFVAEKYTYIRKGGYADSGNLYTRGAFDENCDMKNVERAYNKMDGRYDSNNPISFESSLIGAEFSDYVNNYYETLKEKGAEMYFVFCPVNEAAVSDFEAIDPFCDFLRSEFKFSLLGSPYSSLYEAEWFYDSNVHLNESGMIVHTLTLLNNLKNLFGSTTPNNTPFPEKPEIPPPENVGGADNSDAVYFEYEKEGSGYKIVALNAEGKGKKHLTIPGVYNERPVLSLAAETFSGNKTIESVTIQENITSLPDNLFSDCTSLRTIKLMQADPEKLGVGYGLLNGTRRDCYIYVPDTSLGIYHNNYFWGHYVGRYKTY